ncbi:MAG: hypothetical protein K0R34_3546 [Herbinix sp.]|jgi:hypothetical protein|nr:hypothetical protein [Herbinix sp.]
MLRLCYEKGIGVIMSKFMKLLSTGIDIISGSRSASGEYSMDDFLNLEQLFNLIQWMETFYNQQKVYYLPLQKIEETGSVQVIVKDETGKGVPAQIKFFPIVKDKSDQKLNNIVRNHKMDNHIFDSIDTKVNFIREITDWHGRLDTRLPIGDYYVEISKGSEYEISSLYLGVYSNQTSQIMKELVRIYDLQKENWYSGDLHHHSIYSSPVYGGTDPVIESPALVCQSMAAMGATFGALSDHHNTLNHKVWKALKSIDFTPILSKEISTSNGHVMSLGVDQDVIYQIPKQSDRTDTYLRNEFIRVTDEIKRLGGLPQINHPCDLSKAISWNTKYNDIIRIFETMEVWNGSNPMITGSTNYKAFLWWRQLLEEDCFIPATAGSDTHNIYANDYHIYFDKMDWLAERILERRVSLPKELDDQIASFTSMYQDMLPILKKWANNNLTSAGVRTYVHIEGEITQEKILDSLKQGRSFLTNGPILIPEIDGKLPGDTVLSRADKVDIKLRLLANRPLKQVTLYSKGNKETRFTLDATDKVRGCYDYSRILSDITINDVDWIFLIAEDDCTNMAITNPIFIKRESHKSDRLKSENDIRNNSKKGE